MSRSHKKAIINSSKKRTEEHRRRERRKVKEVLNTEPFSDIVERDFKELGNDEWGTKFDLEHECDEYWEEEKEKLRRK